MIKNTITRIAATLLILVVSAFYVQSQCITCPDVCEELVETPITNGFAFDFADAGAFAGNGFLGLNPGANNTFAGNGLGVDAAIQGFALDEICMSGDFTLADADPSDFPITIEFRIENNCGGFPCPWVDFFTTVNANGTYSIGGLLSTANVGAAGPFDPALGGSIIISIVNFTGTPTVGTPVITYSPIDLVGATCEPIMGCVPTAGEWGLICMTIAFLSFGLIFIRTRSFELQLD